MPTLQELRQKEKSQETIEHIATFTEETEIEYLNFRVNPVLGIVKHKVSGKVLGYPRDNGT